MKEFLILFLSFFFVAPLQARNIKGVEISIEGSRSWHYQVKGEFFVESSSFVAWNVLSDYENIPSFVSSMRVSKVESRSKGSVLLRQTVSDGFLFFNKEMNVLLDVKETPQKAIEFEDVLNQDFHLYKGYWKIEPALDGCRVTYFLEVGGNFSLPVFVSKRVLKKSSEKLLYQVYQEIHLRGGN